VRPDTVTELLRAVDSGDLETTRKASPLSITQRPMAMWKSPNCCLPRGPM
jgi:hypothetical protein